MDSLNQLGLPPIAVVLIDLAVPAIAVALVAAAFAWLLQRRMPRWHPVLVAVLACVLIVVTTILGLGIVVMRGLSAIGAAGYADIANAAPLASLVIYGGTVIALLPFVGLPVAILTAFRTRRIPKGSE